MIEQKKNSFWPRGIYEPRELPRDPAREARVEARRLELARQAKLLLSRAWAQRVYDRLGLREM